MEITEQNHGSFLGYEDGKTAIFINETNYTKKFQEYLDSPDDPKWEKIAKAGRRHVLENLSNDKGVEKLVSIIEFMINRLEKNFRKNIGITYGEVKAQHG